MKKMLAALGAALIATSAQADTHKLTKLWESEASMKIPESVRFDAKRKVVYVSNIDGDAWTADGKGSIAKIGLDGKVINAEWITGLDAPKGLALAGKLLYAADVSGIVVIDVEKGVIVKKIPVPGAQGLNDAALDDKAKTLYITDMKAAKILAIDTKSYEITTLPVALKSPNGLLVHKGVLHVLDNDSVNKINADGTLKVISDGMPGGADGLENVAGDDFLVSVWKGALWYVSADGSKQLLLDGAAEKMSTADIGWDPKTRTVYVPTFFRNTVVAFKVE